MKFDLTNWLGITGFLILAYLLLKDADGVNKIIGGAAKGYTDAVKVLQGRN